MGIPALVRAARLVVAGTVLGSAASACTCGDRSSGDAGQRPDGAAALSPLQAESWRIDLPVSGHGAATVAIPLGATSARPVLIALHGDSDRPEWHCGSWRGITGGTSFILCPRGVPRAGTERFTYADAAATERELRAALRALKDRFGDYLAPSPVMLAGLTLGAERAVATRGGQRVLFVCTRPGCRQSVESSVLFLTRAGAAAQVVDGGVGAHGLDATTSGTLARIWPWLVQGDPRFARSEGQ
jgi:hypothetical protein